MGFAHFFVAKFDPNHDKLGRFASAPGAGGIPDGVAEHNDASLAKLAATYQADSRMGEAGYAAFAQKATDMINRAHVYRWANDTTLGKILASGRLKSQFETDTSDGMLNPRVRRQQEKLLFGYDEHATPADHRPIYGFMADPANLKEDAFGAGTYGNVILEFKPEIRARTTVTGGDSLDGTYHPSPLSHFNPASLLPNERTALVSQQAKNLPAHHSIKEFQNTLQVNYLEAQMHGGVTARDIAKVIDPYGKVDPGTQATLKERGIRYVSGWSGEGAKPVGSLLLAARDRLRAERGLPPFGSTKKMDGFARYFTRKFNSHHAANGEFASSDGAASGNAASHDGAIPPEDDGTHPPQPGQPFTVYRLASADKNGLTDRNAANTGGLASYLYFVDNDEGPDNNHAVGDTIHRYTVTVNQPFGEFTRQNQGQADHATGGLVGRRDDRGDVVYSFPKGGQWTAVPTGSVKLADVRAIVKDLQVASDQKHGWPPFAKPTGDFNYSGGDRSMEALRLAWANPKLVQKFDPNHNPANGQFASTAGGSFTLNLDLKRSDVNRAMQVLRHQPHEHPNIIGMKVGGRPVFGDRNLGIARQDMPQIPSTQRDTFLHSLHVPVTRTALDPTTLTPIQNQLDGFKVSQVYNDLRHGNERVDKPIIVSQDHYIIDGHHHWGGKMLQALSDPSTKINAYVVHMDHQPLLAAAHQFDLQHGIHGKDITKMEGFARFFVTKYNANHGKDGRFTSGSGASTITERSGGAEFMSPQEGANLDLSQAMAEIRKDPHVRFREFSDQVDRALGITSSEQHDALGDWNTGAENAIFDRVHGNVGFDTIKAAAAIKGLVANQMMVIPFKVEQGGPDSLYRFQVKDDINNVRKVLNDHGIENRTLIPRPDGSINVVLYDHGTQLRDNVKGVAQHYGTPIRLARGKGELFGSFDSRDAGRAAYQQFLSGWMAGGRDRRATVEHLLSDYRSRYPAQPAQKSERGFGAFFVKKFNASHLPAGPGGGEFAPNPGGLSLSTQARMSRAKAMGFDPKRVFYHGTVSSDGSALRAFDPAKIGTVNDNGYMGRGFYFSEDPEVASAYSQVNTENGSYVMPVHLRLQNTKVFHVNDGQFDSIRYMLGQDPNRVPTPADAQKMSDYWRSKGYDSVAWAGNNGRLDEVMVLDPEQIRSVNATFDPKEKASPDILKAEMATTTPKTRAAPSKT